MEEQWRGMKTNNVPSADVQTTMAEDGAEVVFPVARARLSWAEINFPLSEIKPILIQLNSSVQTNVKNQARG